MGSHRRRLASTVLLAAAALLLSAASAFADPPDLVQKPLSAFLPEGASGTPTIVQNQGQDRLVFSSSISNLGGGSLLLNGSRADTTVETMSAFQTVDGVRSLVGAFQYNVDPSHQHWHFLDLDRYELRTHTPANSVIGIDQKTGFCVAPMSTITGQDCQRNVPQALSLSEQLAPGESDRYDPSKDGQFIDVTGVPPGDYELVEWANPICALSETNHDDNATSMVITIHAGSPPTVTADGVAPTDFTTWWANNPHCLPSETVRPQLSANPSVGGHVTVTPGSWLTRLASGFRYQWRRCNRAGNACKNIRGATRSTYSPTAADGGHTLRGRVTATKGSDVEQLTPQDSDQTSVLLKASVSVHTKVLLSSLLEHGLPFKVKCSSACSGDARLVASGKRKLKSTAHASRAVANLIASPYIDDEAREDLQHLVRTAGFVFAEKRVSLHHSGTVSSRVRVTKKLRGRLKKRHLGKVTLRVTVRTNTGQLRSIVKKVRIVF